MEYICVLFNGAIIVLVFCGKVNLQKPLEYQLPEEQPVGTVVGNILIDSSLHTRYEASTLNLLRFSFRQRTGLHLEYFVLEQATGVLRTTKRMDKETTCPLDTRCIITADVTVLPRQYFQSIKVRITLLDINDNWPTFSESKKVLTLSEAQLLGVVSVLPAATDMDIGENGIAGYKLQASSSNFKVHADKTGNILLELVKMLDRETSEFHQLRIIAFDGGTPSRSGSILVEISVTDINDNRPKFRNSSYTVRVLENKSINSQLLRVQAHDADAGVNGQVTYKFTQQTEKAYGQMFAINGNTGVIVLKGRLDFQKQPSYLLSVLAIDKGPNAVPVGVQVTIIVIDINDHAPVITVHDLTPTGVIRIVENTGRDAFVAHISVQDQDGGENGKFSCTLDGSYFHLQPMYDNEYKLVTKQNIDREKRPKYTIRMQCIDNGRPRKKSSMLIVIVVDDKNDNAPAFSQDTYFAKIPENNKKGDMIIQINASDRDMAENSMINYELEGRHSQLEINPINGQVLAKVSFDREKLQELDAVVFASDKGKPSLTSSATILITIEDRNDEAPRFSQPKYGFHIMEGQPAGTEVGRVYATDADSVIYNTFIYSVKRRRHDQAVPFIIDGKSGIIRTTEELSRNNISAYHFTITASDTSAPWLSSITNVSVFVVGSPGEVIAQTPAPAPTILGLSGYNWIVICALSGALLLMLIIIITVVVCYSRRRRRQIDRRGYISGNLVRITNREGEAVRTKGELLRDSERLQDTWGTLMGGSSIPYFYADDKGSDDTVVQSNMCGSQAPSKIQAMLDQQVSDNLRNTLKKIRRSLPEGGHDLITSERGRIGSGKLGGSCRVIHHRSRSKQPHTNSGAAEIQKRDKSHPDNPDSDSVCSADVSNSDSNVASDDQTEDNHGCSRKVKRAKDGEYEESVSQNETEEKVPFHSDAMSSPDSLRSKKSGSRDGHDGRASASGLHKVALVHPQRNGKRNLKNTEWLSLSDSCQGQFGSSFEEETSRVLIGRGLRESDLEGDSDTCSEDAKDSEVIVTKGKRPYPVKQNGHCERLKESGLPENRNNVNDDDVDEAASVNDTDFYESDGESRGYNITV